MKRCNICGNESADDSLFCAKCGNSFNAENNMQQPPQQQFNNPQQIPPQYPPQQPPYPQQIPPQQPVKEKKKGHGCLIAILVVVGIFVLFGILGAFLSSDTDSSGSTTESTTISESDYKSQCEKIDYKELARNPDEYEGKYFTFTGQVEQVVDDGTYRINVTKDEYGFYEDTIYVTYTLPEGASRILEDDIVTFYGESKGIYTYTSVMGSSVSIPEIEAQYFEIKD